MIGLQASLRVIFLITDLYGRAQYNVGVATPEQMVLNGIRKQTEQTTGESQQSSLLNYLHISFLLSAIFESLP